MPSNTVDDAVGLLRDRLKELDAERAKGQGGVSNVPGGGLARRGPGRPPGSGAGRPRGRKRGRRRNTRADQAVRLVQDNPGISASEIANKMRIKPNYMYRVLGDLQKEGRVKKSGRAYTAA